LDRPPRIIHTSLEALALEAVLELLARSKAAGVLAVESEVTEGELLWEGGRLYDAQVVYRGRPPAAGPWTTSWG
jgi:hypothetical protein